jgi:hypothetical protein
MLALWARYQWAALGCETNAIHAAIVGDDGAPPRPPARWGPAHGSDGPTPESTTGPSVGSSSVA